MSNFADFQINVFALLLLLALFFTMQLHSKLDCYGKQILRIMVVLTTIAVIVEPLTWYFDGKNFFFEYFTNAILVLLAPIIANLMFLYISFKICYKRKNILKSLFRFPPTIFTFIMIIINIFYPLYFDVNINNNYVRGDYFWIHFVMIFILYLVVLIHTITSSKRANLRKLIIIYSFFLLPIIGVLLSTLDSHIFLTWTSIALSIFVIYIFLETNSGELDYLTGLFNRQSFEKHITELIHMNESFSILYLDLDHFKRINDTHGHLFGDNVLIQFSNLLQSTFSIRDMVCRLGGDEFMIILRANMDYENIILSLKEKVLQSSCEELQELKFSYGYQEYQPSMSLDDLYICVDRKMYEYKKTHKKFNRRTTDQSTNS